MNLAKILLPLATLGIFLISKPLCAETLFCSRTSGTIPIGTNETILITTVNVDGGFSLPDLVLLLDGSDVSIGANGFFGGEHNLPLVLTGPHDLNVSLKPPYSSSYNFFLTFQRITNSPIKTVVALINTTNFIDVPIGKTIQLLPPLGTARYIFVEPQGSTNWFHIAFTDGVQTASIAGPATIQVCPDSDYVPQALALSYYFPDDVVQFPPTGLLSVPAPILEVNIEKSYDLKTWLPSATFHTDAEASAFYRLKMLK
ncbi:MAG: hypothetical protein WCS94_24150 [Verrucomicrobiota bacterium]